MSKYPTNWFDLLILEGTTIELPGIYRWSIEDKLFYIGRYTRKSRPLGEYPKNIHRIRQGLPYRPSNPEGFRAVHLFLAQAAIQDQQITLTIVENCEVSLLNERERFYINQIDPERRLNGMKRTQ